MIDHKCHKQYSADAKGLKVEPGGRQILARISTTAVDREGDVMLPSGLDMKDFMKNPVVMYEHAAWPVDAKEKLPVGTVPKGGIKKDSDGVTALVDVTARPPSLPPEQEWWPDTILDLLKMKALRGFSVGFIIKDARQATEKDLKKFGDGVRRVITNWSMFEFSVCAIPMNQECLAEAVSKGINPKSWAVRGLAKPDQLVIPAPFDLTPSPVQFDAPLCVNL